MEATKAPLWVRGFQFCAVFLLVTVLGLSALIPCGENASWVAQRLGNLGGGLKCLSLPLHHLLQRSRKALG